MSDVWERIWWWTMWAGAAAVVVNVVAITAEILFSPVPQLAIANVAALIAMGTCFYVSWRKRQEYVRRHGETS